MKNGKFPRFDFKNPRTSGLNLFVGDGDVMRWGSRDFGVTSSVSEKKVQEVIYLFFLLKSTRQKSPSLKTLIGLLGFVVGMLWPKKQIK